MRRSSKDRNHDAIVKVCLVCKEMFYVRRSHADLRAHCSKKCMAFAYSLRMRGASNPNWRNSAVKTCAACGKQYANYSKKSKYCSRECYVLVSIDRLRSMAYAARKDKPKKIVKPRVCAKAPNDTQRKTHPGISRICGYCKKEALKGRRYCCDECKICALAAVTKKMNCTCAQCGITFHAYSSQHRTRRFCSYACHLASGGAKRAGEAAVMAKRKYGNKKDANHKEIVDAFEALGASVLDLSDMGCGVPDLIVWCMNGWQLVDVKNPKTGYGRRGLNPLQREWASKWKGGPVYMVSTIDDVVALINGKKESVKSFGGYDHV